jgi:predicted DsbA family dithiol-disulfide isomerase
MQVEIWSDVVCPWCYIGKRRFETALARFEHKDAVQVTWRSFELDPSAPRLREDTNTERLAQKYGMSVEQAQQSHDRVTQLAAQENLTYHLAQARSGNTFDAHRLIHLAAQHGVQDAAKERLLRAYFTEGEAIGEQATLFRLAQDVGIDEAEAQQVLTSDAFADAVRADEQEARELGINGVPFFVLDRRYGVSGAQPADHLLQALQQAWADAHPKLVMAPVGGAEACTDDTCSI